MDTDEGNTLKGKMKVNEDSSHVILCEDHCTKIADKIADRLAEREKLRVKAEEETEFKSKLKILNERDIQHLYIAYLNYSHREKVSKSPKVHKVGTFGVFKKLVSTRRINKERRENLKKHFKNPLHKWCQQFAKESQKNDYELRWNNMYACTKAVTNLCTA